ncbi:MAG: VCBS repeat-containing protein, partial [Gammaproteobacteria bacterium]|nr:VCBS repeat-containing protein [Gammaproteobacteria bacterium]
TKSGVSRTIATNSRSSLPNFNLGDPFSIEVTVNPVNKRCSVSNSNTTGLIDGASDNVNITCLGLFSVGGNITGLEGDNLVLRLNAEDDLPIDKTDNFTFSTPLVDGSAYAVIVQTQPSSSPDQFCTVANGIGTVSSANVSNVAITCVNSIPPTASNVSITDENDESGNAVVGDNLTGHYLYNDVDGDVEGASTFRWLRNGEAISGAVSSTYTLVADDVPTQIIFEVTPVTTTGETGSATTSAVLATGTAPVVSGFARYLDINTNSVNDAKDQLIIPFDQEVITDAVNSTDFNLPVTGDTFGAGATVTAGPASNEVTITLGASPHFITRQDFSDTVTVAGSASGIDVAASMIAGVIQSASGIDATPSAPIDLIPGYVASFQFLGAYNSDSVALGDLDGDGDLDMVVANGQFFPANSGDYNNRVYINDGGGRFTVFSQELGTNSDFVALGDVDGDGGLDIVLSKSKGNRIYINVDGAGSFAYLDQVLGSGGSFALGDVDGDGDLDMVVTDPGEDNFNRVYKNGGAGNFINSNQLLGANISLSIALGDVDGDGDLDMVVANTQANRIYKNSDGTGSFLDSGQTLGTSYSTFVTLGDVDGDGDLDMVVANTHANRVYKNDGDGNFIDTGQVLGLSYSTSVVLGDVDSDGDLDMVVANFNLDEQNRVYLNDGTGSFTDSGQLLGTNNRSNSVVLGDIDGDGDLDMVVANGGRGEPNRVYLNSLAGTE